MSPKVVVTGAGGFIGSNLVDFLLTKGYQVVGVDNFSTGRREFLESALENSNFNLLEIDLLRVEIPESALKNADAVFHFAANADVRFGPSHPEKDLEQNTIVTQKVLEAARKAHIGKFLFSSTGSVYGESNIVPTPENAPFPIQTSLYGASKLACEGLISAYSESFGMKVWIFRFVSILGPRYSHGHVFDFYKQLMDNPNQLVVLGDGHQKKSYLHVEDCISAIYKSFCGATERINIFNLGVDDYCEVRDSIEWITDQLTLQPRIIFGTESKGWVGDNPMIYLDTKSIRNFGWEPHHSIENSIRSTVKFIQENSWILNDSRNN